MAYTAKKTFAHGKRTHRKGEVIPAEEIKGYEEKLLSLGLIEKKAQADYSGTGGACPAPTGTGKRGKKKSESGQP